MKRIPAMVSMKRSAPEKADIATPDVPDYPYGLGISLGDDELEKLGMKDDVAVGDMVHIHAMAKVTSVSKHDSEGGSCCRVELQITDMVGENEDEENDDADKVMPAAKRQQRLYGA